MRIEHILEHAVRHARDREAVVCGPVRLTYAALWERSRRLASALLHLGLDAGDRVAILSMNCHRYVESYYGASMARLVLVPLNTRLAPAEIAAILKSSEARALILDPRFTGHLDPLETAESLPEQIIPFNEDAAHRNHRLRSYETLLAGADPLPAPALQRQAGPEDEEEIAQLYYTSGTTGRAKGVMLTHRNVLANAMNQIAAMPWREGDVWLHAAPMFHLADAWATFVVTWKLGKQVCIPAFDPKVVLETIASEKVTETILVPTMINAVVNEPTISSYDLSSLRFMIYGASPMPVELLRSAIRVLSCEFAQGYGLTEASPLLTTLQPEDHVLEGPPERTRRLASCGREITGVRVRVVRKDGTEVAPGEVGEIVASGPNIMKGYWRDPEATREAIVDTWLHTGDLATRDEENYIYIVDRKKDMIISGGENIYSTEVEDVLYSHPDVQEAAVIGLPDEKWGERVAGVVVLREGSATTAEDLIAFCREKIAAYKVPKQIELREELPKTGSGKIAKRELREPYWTGRDRLV